MATDEISADFNFTIHRVKVDNEVEMAYLDTDPTQTQRDRPPIVFLHGCPVSSYLWRNIIPHLSSKARCIAPDLIGYGYSHILPSVPYGFHDHVRYLDSFFSKVLSSSESIVLVLHDYGSLFGFNWARRHSERIAGLVFMEFFPPMPTLEHAGKMPDGFVKAISGPPEQSRKAIIDDNLMIELVIPDQVIRTLSQEEMDHYRRPFVEHSSRESLLKIGEFFPVAGNPPDVYEAVEKYHSWLLENEILKLFFWADPGKLISPRLAKWYSDNLKNVKSVAVGKAKHFLQEDHPHVIGREIGEWLESTGIRSGPKV